MIDVKTYPVAHGKEKGGGGGVTYITGSVANSDLPDNINVASINASNGNIDYLTGKSLTYNDGAINYLSSADANIANIAGNNLDYANGTISHLNADEITTGKITAKEAEIEKAWIEILNSKNITTEYLTVTKQAHFFELIIDKIKSVGGTIIETAANCIVDKVKAYSVKTTPANHDISEYEIPLTANNILSYGIFFRSKNDNRQISNDWWVNDQAICQSFNATEGVSHNVANKYYWRLVTEKLAERYMNLKTGEELPIDTANPPASSEAVVQFNNDQYLFRVTYTTYDSNGDPVESTVKDGWTISPQTVDNIPQAQWDNTNKKMTTTSTAFGIKLVADNSEQVYDDQTQTISNITVGNVIPTKFEFKCTTAARLNVGVIYTDSTSQWFPAPAEARDSYVDDGTNNYAIHLNANNTISMIVITNAEEGDWQTVHGILLSNDLNASPKEVDDTVTNQQEYSAPSEGDNLAQLGYRGQDDPKRSSAIIIAAYQTPDSGVHPPSYAQYRGITDFNLSSHRQTYFDAYDAQFVGNFMVTSGGTQIPIKDYIDDLAVTYTMYTAYADASTQGPNPSTPVLNVNWSKGAPLDPNWTYMGIATSTDANDTNLQFDNYSWFLIQGSTGPQGATGPAGPAGKYTTFAYRNATSNPLPQGATSTSSLPSGFARAVSSPPAGQYTWMTQSETQLVGATETFGFWNPAIRITGDKGNPGEDGTDIEFIYTRNNGNNGSPNPPAAPPSTFDPGPTGATYNGVYWTNHPVGVAGATMYEYVCQRIKGPTGAWSAYQPSPAAVWSKWGEKGMDGDGYEYIYKAGATYGQLPSTIVYDKDGNLRTQEYIQTHDDFVPMGWHDEPVTLSEDSGPEWVSTRKKEDGSWGAFSDPKVWAHWAEPGSVGPTGPQGPTGPKGDPGDGADAIQYKIIDVGSYAGITATLSDDPNVIDPAQTLTMSLSYKVAKIVGATATIMKISEINDLGANVYYRLSKEERTEYDANYYYYKLNVVNDNNNNNNEAKFVISYTTSSKKIIDDNKSIAIAFIKSTASSFTISSPEASKMYDTVQIVPVMQPSATFRILQGQNASISSLVAGSGVTGPTIANMWTEINQNASAISLNAVRITNLKTEMSQIRQTADSITSTVSSINNGAKNYFNFTYTNLTTNAWPYIQGYGLEGYGEQSNNPQYKYFQVRNLDFGTNPLSPSASDIPKITMSVRCRMRMQSNNCNILVGLCNTEPTNITPSGDRREVTVTTQWKEFIFTYEIPNDTNHFNASTGQSTTANGHITFEGITMNYDNRLYIDRLMITFGTPPIDQYTVSWRDYENSKITRYDALKIDDSSWNINNSLNVAYPNESHKGYPVMLLTSSEYCTDVDFNYVSLNTSSLENNKHYTLSFYAKTTNNTYSNYKFQAFMANAFEVPPYNEPNFNSTTPIENLTVWPTKAAVSDLNVNTSKGNNCDGQTNFQLNIDWQKVTIHWYKKKSGNVTVIPLRVLKQGTNTQWRLPDIYIAGIELREGWWDDNSLESTSMIAQTANEIELKVKNTGINIDDGTITLSADNTFVDGNLVLKHNEGAQGLIFRNSSNQDGLKISTSNLPQLSTWLNGYQGYPKLDVATNGFGFQSGSRYLYAATSDLALHDGNAGGVNNEYQIDVRLRQDGGNTGQIKDYIGRTEFGSNDNNTAYVKFLASETMVQHNGVRIIHPAHNYNYSNFQVSSKDKILLCDPNGDKQTSSNLNQRAVTLNFPSNCVGHYYFIKRLHNVGRIYINGYVYAGTLNLADTPLHNPYINDNGLWMAIIVDGLNPNYQPATQIILNKIADNDRPNTD